MSTLVFFTIGIIVVWFCFKALYKWVVPAEQQGMSVSKPLDWLSIILQTFGGIAAIGMFVAPFHTIAFILVGSAVIAATAFVIYLIAQVVMWFAVKATLSRASSLQSIPPSSSPE